MKPCHSQHNKHHNDISVEVVARILLHKIFHRVPHTNLSMAYSTHTGAWRSSHNKSNNKFLHKPSQQFTHKLSLIVTMVRNNKLYFTEFSHRSWNIACEIRCEQGQMPINTVYKESLIKSHKPCKQKYQMQTHAWKEPGNIYDTSHTITVMLPDHK